MRRYQSYLAMFIKHGVALIEARALNGIEPVSA
jgi:hypothetical protein